MMGKSEKHGSREQLGYRARRAPEYVAWCSMLQRCYDPEQEAWEYYGGRGITVCDRWRTSFSAFLKDMGPKPKPHREYSLDRKDNNMGYEPGNCHWATAVEQGRNRRNNVHIARAGETRCLADWSEQTGIRSGTIADRLRNKWPEEALLLPLQMLPKNTYKPFTIGDAVGLLTIVEYGPPVRGPKGQTKRRVKVLCVCGDAREVDEYELHRGDKSTCGRSRCRTRWRAQLEKEQSAGIWRVTAKCSIKVHVDGTLYRVHSLAGRTHTPYVRSNEGAIIAQRADQLILPTQPIWLGLPTSPSTIRYLAPFTENQAVEAIRLSLR